MQGIEPKFHTTLIERMKYYSLLLKESEDDPYLQSSEAINKVSQLIELYEEYLSNKRKLEKSIKNYKDYHQNLQRLLTPRIRHLKRKIKQG